MKRGIYKKYLEDDEVPIPETTRRRHRLMQETMVHGISSGIKRNCFYSCSDTISQANIYIAT